MSNCYFVARFFYSNFLILLEIINAYFPKILPYQLCQNMKELYFVRTMLLQKYLPFKYEIKKIKNL